MLHHGLSRKSFYLSVGASWWLFFRGQNNNRYYDFWVSYIGSKIGPCRSSCIIIFTLLLRGSLITYLFISSYLFMFLSSRSTNDLYYYYYYYFVSFRRDNDNKRFFLFILVYARPWPQNFRLYSYATCRYRRRPR